METKFTPGPWGWWPTCCGEPGGIVTQERGQHVARPVHFERAPEVSAANARLIAAAPDLLAACMAGLHALKVCADHRSDEIGELEEAIAKALGGTAG